jgi:hypothetical protein
VTDWLAGRSLSTRQAMVVATGAAIVGFTIAYVVMRGPDRPGDFLYWYTAAQALVRGESPYDVIPTIDPERFLTGFFYPLPAAILAVPFSFLPYALAGGLFVGISAGLLAYGVARSGAHRLWLFASAPFIVSAASGTWSTPLAAAALLPALGFLAVVKPNVGIATFLYRPSWQLVVGAAAVAAISLLVRPSWPMEWLNEVGGVQNRVIPILTPVGPLLLLGLTRWRLPETRLLLGYACVPQAPWFYDQLILWLIPRNSLESINYTFVSQVFLAIWIVFDGVLWKHGNWLLAAVLYLPPLVMILRRPNINDANPVA